MLDATFTINKTKKQTLFYRINIILST